MFPTAPVLTRDSELPVHLEASGNIGVFSTQDMNDCVLQRQARLRYTAPSVSIKICQPMAN
jgi:hypothetical protein